MVKNNYARLVANLAVAQRIPSRNGFGEALLPLGKSKKNVVVLSADLAESTRALAFAERHPERFFDAGVAEQNLMGVAAGLAMEGKIPFVCSYAVFSPARNWDQLRVSVCYSEANVKIFGGHAGIITGADGATHQGLEDIAITRALPNMTVVVPCDYLEGRKATIESADIKGPVYLRFGREKVPAITTEETPFRIGRAEIFRDGKDVAIIACGEMVCEALIAAEKLSKEGIDAMVVNNHTIKPIDKKTLAEVARKTGAIVTAEDHQIHGGLGSAVAEALSENPVPIKMIGVNDVFGESGEPEELMKKYGLTHKEIMDACRSILKKKAAVCLEVHEEEIVMPRTGILEKIHPEFYFKVRGEEPVRTIGELHKKLAKMDDDTFRHHVNNHKNDFSTWIKDIFKDEHLSNLLLRHKTKEGMKRAIAKYLEMIYRRRNK